MTRNKDTKPVSSTSRVPTVFRRALWVFLVAVAVGVALPFGCVGNRMFNPDPGDFLRRFETPGGVPYAVAVVEFDDQGEVWDPRQLEAALEEIRRLNRLGSSGIVLYQFIHGWKSNADRDRSSGRRLAWFEARVARLAERSEALARGTNHQAQPIVGLFIGWRGRTYSLPVLIDASFWNRRVAANRLVSPALDEVLTRTAVEAKRDPDSKCALVGHSMGGMILEKTIGRSLVTAVELVESSGRSIPLSYDLIVSANPSTEALHSRQLIDLLKRAEVGLVLEDETGALRPAGGPMIASITSSEDGVTKYMIPLAMNFNSLFVRYRPADDAAGPSQRRLGTHTAGHTPYLFSHEVSLSGTEITIRTRPNRWNDTPFWVFQVPPEISADHGDIDGPLWHRLMIQLLDANRVFDPEVDLRLAGRPERSSAETQPPPPVPLVEGTG